MKTEENPTISVNKLGEFLTSSTTKKKSIIKDQIEKPPVKINIYSPARNPIINFIVSEMADGGAAEIKAASLREDKSGSIKQVQNRQLAAEAIESFLQICPSIDLGNLAPKKGSSLSTKISEVEVKLNPEVILENNKGETKGFIKLHFSKTSNFSKRTKDTITSVIAEKLEESGQKLDNSKCYLVDIGTKSIATAPKSRKKIMNEVHDDCEIYSLLYKNHILKLNS